MIALASDHGGFQLKEAIKRHLTERKYDIIDLGTNSDESVDYPIYGIKAAKAVTSGQCNCAIVCCGTGIGISIAANKIKGIRCALVTNEFMAEMAKRHNNANMLALGGRVLDVETAKRLVDIWLSAEFEGGRHQKRIEMIEEA